MWLLNVNKPFILFFDWCITPLIYRLCSCYMFAVWYPAWFGYHPLEIFLFLGTFIIQLCLVPHSKLPLIHNRTLWFDPQSRIVIICLVSHFNCACSIGHRHMFILRRKVKIVTLIHFKITLFGILLLLFLTSMSEVAWGESMGKSPLFFELGQVVL